MKIITGASKGIGKFLLKKYIELNEEVVGTYWNSEPTDNKEHYFKVDITNEMSIINFINSIKERADKISLINCAGINYNSITLKFDFSEWKNVFETNIHGTFLITKHILPIMREQNFGRIINIASVTSQKGTVGTSAYSSTKSALWGLTRVVANENATKGVTCNCLNLGYFNIGMITQVPENILNEIIKTIPQKKLGDPINIYNAINFLTESDYITGTEININGGLY
jgi:acetoacetyl-CoA reductase/3-oxoacyl-[acyl-carrier protein] reductase